jgi:hypothetical protein
LSKETREYRRRHLECSLQPTPERKSFHAPLQWKGQALMKSQSGKTLTPGPDANENCIITAGEIFPAGPMIELVRSESGLTKPDLLFWNGKKSSVEPRIKYGNRLYEGPELDTTLYRTMRLPARCSNYDSARALFEAIAELFEHHLGLLRPESSLLACFPLSTWVADRLANPLSLAICCSDEALGIDVLRLLDCLCRHPLLLSEVSPASLRSLPMHLSPTLLLNQQELRPNVLRVLRASCYPGLNFAGAAGRMIELSCAKAIFGGNDDALDALAGDVIRVSLMPSRLRPSDLDEKTRQQIADHFQPQLLSYRLQNCGKVHGCEIDVSRFAIAMQPVARALAQCFPADPELAADAVQLLLPQDNEIRQERTSQVDYVIVDVLLAMFHQQTQAAVGVTDLTKDVNLVLEKRGEIWSYSAEEIGRQLAGLKIARKRDGSGQRVKFDRDTSQRLQRWARAYDLLPGEHSLPGCTDCGEAQAVSPQ